MMLFSEVYGSYFNVLAAILEEAVKKRLTTKKIDDIIREKAFSESELMIKDNLNMGEWKFLDMHHLCTPLRHVPTMPLTVLQKRWMKSLLLDPRIRLFAPDETGLEDVKPLYQPEWFVYYDRYGSGDPYEDEIYIAHFRTILQALQDLSVLEIYFCGRTGAEHVIRCIPERLEYSSKDDRFRLIAADNSQWQYHTINLARITECRILNDCGIDIPPIPQLEDAILEFELVDERNALERVMLNFSHLKKETKRLDDNRYHVKMYYDQSDETEILIRILSFGAMIRVVSPDSFIEKIRERIKKQSSQFIFRDGRGNL